MSSSPADPTAPTAPTGSERPRAGGARRSAGDVPLPERGRGPVRRDGDPVEIARTIVDDAQLLFQKHIELAKIEIADAVEARIKAVIAATVAGLFGLFALGFLASAAAFALEGVMPAWLARLTVAGGFLLITAVGALYGRARLLSPPFAPERTKEILEEDREWIKARLER